MTGTLVDSSVLLDLVTDDPVWGAWSLRHLDAAAGLGPVLINPVVYSEVSVGYARIEDFDRLLADAGLPVAELPRSALFLAGKAFLRYRRTGGLRTGVLPDFFIGAHAAITGMRLLTRDAARVASYFPTLDLVTPPVK
ncbi:MAG: type II toxin-antitoxin system VapC family toxin [Hyphomonas sp.]